MSRRGGRSQKDMAPAALLRKEADPGTLAPSFAGAEVFRQLAVQYLLAERSLLLDTRPEDYQAASWSYSQADRNGAIRTINRILRDVFNVEVNQHGPRPQS